MINQEAVFQNLLKQIKLIKNNYWINKLNNVNPDNIHIAIMVEPYLSLVLSGKKTIESRFSQKKVAPWKCVLPGDAIILKKSGGKIVGVFEASEIKYQEIKQASDILDIKKEYNDRLCIEEAFWKSKENSKYVTLIFISNLCTFEPFSLDSTNRLPWIDFFYSQLSFEESFHLNQNLVICLAGKAGSGKTTVAKYLARCFHCESYTVSDFLRNELVKRNIFEINRHLLQDIGEEYISRGWDFFCHEFLAFTNWNGTTPLIIDGVRHLEFFKALEICLYPTPLCLIFLSADEKTLLQNVEKRGSEIIDKTRLAEGNQENLEWYSDMIVPVDGKGISDIANEIYLFLSNHSFKNRRSDKNTNIHDLVTFLDCFNELRGWKRYHNARDLSISISLEAAELLEIFQWSGLNRCKLTETQDKSLREELADIIIYCINLANSQNIDITKIILDKIQKNKSKYPELPDNLKFGSKNEK